MSQAVLTEMKNQMAQAEQALTKSLITFTNTLTSLS